MAPRRLPKRRETRMDAAIDAMSLMGFPEQLVRDTVIRLIKNVYGGPDCWVFIEENGYRELIEILLADQNQANGSAAQDKLGDGHNEASPSGCSNRTLLPCSTTETCDVSLITNQAVDTVSASSQTVNQLSIQAVESVSPTSEAGNQLPIKSVVAPSAAAARQPGNQLPSIEAVNAAVSANNEPGNQLSILKDVDEVSADNQSGDQLCIIKVVDVVSANNRCGDQLSILDSRPAHSPPQPTERVGRRRRRPCYGWISNDDEEDEEELKLIRLPPMSRVMSM